MTIPPRIYESDYNRAVRDIHNTSVTPFSYRDIQILTVEGKRITAEETDGSVANLKHFVTLRFFSTLPDIVNGYRYWRLQTEVTIVPDIVY